MQKRLLLFDIDGTLLDTGGAGGAALLDAAEEVLGATRETVPPLDLAGATDGAVIRKIFADIGEVMSPARVAAFHASYLRHLQARVDHAEFAGALLSGVAGLLLQLSEERHFSVGLLTGNIRRGAGIKLRRFGIAQHFADGGFGDDAEHRDQLGPVAVQRMERATNHRFASDQVIVIGDTPRDIACAHAMGARCLAVATGRFKRPELSPHSCWALLDDLADTGQVIRLLAA